MTDIQLNELMTLISSAAVCIMFAFGYSSGRAS